MSKQQKGFTLLESVLTLGFAVALAAATFGLYGITDARSLAVTTQHQITAIAQATRGAYVSTGWAPASIQAAIDEGWLPSDVVVSHGQALNAWGGIYQISGDDTGFVVGTSGVPSEACVPLVSEAGGYASVTVDGVAVDPTRADQVAQVCSTGDSHAIGFTTRAR